MKAFPNLNKWKFKKLHKSNNSFFTLTEKKMFFSYEGQYALQALESGKLTFKQIESLRRTLRRTLGKSSQIFIRLFTSVPVSQKSVASRMGKGKGPITYWIAIVKQGKVLVEINCIYSYRAYLALMKAATKLPIKTRILDLRI